MRVALQVLKKMSWPCWACETAALQSEVSSCFILKRAAALAALSGRP
jgi:hypothetical protein